MRGSFQSIIVAVGKAKAGPERMLYEHYAARLNPSPILREVEVKKPMPVDRRIEAEGDLLLSQVQGQVPGAARVVVLDERGQNIGSEAFASKLGGWVDGGTATIVCLIGGADGHAEAVRERADLLLSLGRLTWPHMLVRGLLAEQLYRARCILDGHPYHRA